MHDWKTITVLFALCAACISLSESHTYCAHKASPRPKRDQSGLQSQDGDASSQRIFPNDTIECKGDEKCYTMWFSRNGSKEIVIQGCWDKPTDICSDDICKEHKKNVESGRKSDKFCCCSGDYCNKVLVEMEIITLNTTEGAIKAADGSRSSGYSYSQNTILSSITPIVVGALVIIIGYLIYRLCIRKYKEPVEVPEFSEAPSLPSFELDQLKLGSFIERGRYGEVWKGLLNDHDVAVKIFTVSQRRYYVNERDIYMLPYMEHANLCKFYGTEERIGNDGNGQFLLVMSYVEGGTLTSYLKNNRLNWSTLCRMMQSVTAGLAHLHTEVNAAGKTKPSIAHRDFNTRNILVRPDKACVVCDLGFAMKIARTRFQDEGEMTSLTDVGTLRYMSPEVLDGAVNLRDCEASLKQIDIYALGLVLWEIASQCSDLFQGMAVPEYQLPFQAECGVHPSFEEMQLLVSRNKSRPTFPDVWKDTNQAIRALKETIEDCWDQDAEARLTARCVEERLVEMATLWEARHKGVTPTINTVTVGEFGVGGSSQQQNQSLPQHHPGLSGSHLSQQLHTTDLNLENHNDHSDRNGNLPTMQFRGSATGDPSRSSRHHLSGDYSVSSTTTETTLTSPSEPDTNTTIHHQPSVVLTKANVNLNYAKKKKVPTATLR